MPALSYADSHYAYIEKYGAWFSEQLGVDDVTKFTVAHGDKARQYRDLIEELGVSFKKGSLVYLLSYVKPYSDKVRSTDTGWVSVESWLEKMLTKDTLIAFALSKLPD